MSDKQPSPEQAQKLLDTVKTRFHKHMNRHTGIDWNRIQTKLEKDSNKLWSLNQMERTGGEPDVVGYDKKTDEYIFYDCSPESPKGRRSLCYDMNAWESRKQHKPTGNSRDMAASMGVEMLTEDQYKQLQQLGAFDTKTSSWIMTPPDIRKRGGALYCDRRYDHVFVYHNGAESYYASRGFRALLRV